MTRNKEEITEEAPGVYEDVWRFDENESSEIAASANVKPSTHDDETHANTIIHKVTVMEENGKPELVLSPSLQAPACESSEQESSSSTALHVNMACSTPHDDGKKKTKVQFSNQAPQLVPVGSEDESSSSSDESSSSSSSESTTCATNSVTTDSFYSIKQSPTMLTIDTMSTSTTNLTHETKASSSSIKVKPSSTTTTTTTTTTMKEQVKEQKVKEEPSSQAKLADFKPVSLQPTQTSTNTTNTLPIGAAGTVLGQDVPFAFDEQQDNDDIQESPSRGLDSTQENGNTLQEIAQIIGSHKLVQDLATLYYDRKDLQIIEDEEFCTAVERALAKEHPKKPTTTTTQEGDDDFQSRCMCTENPMKCTVTKEYWESLVESMTAVAQCQETYDMEPSLVKFPSDVKEEETFKVEPSHVKSTISTEGTNETPSDFVTNNIFLSQEKVDQVKASLENDREKIAMLLDSWGKDIQASVVESTNKGAVTRDEFVGIVKSWVNKIQVSTPTTTTSGNTATESKAFARETSSSGKFMSRMSDVACRELVLYNPYQSVANIEASFIKALQTPSTQGGSVLEKSTPTRRDLVLRSPVKIKADETSSEFQAVLFLRMMAELLGEAFGEIALSLRDNRKQADDIVQGAFAALYKHLDSFSAGRHSTDEVTRSSNVSIPTESDIEATIVAEHTPAHKKTIPFEPSMSMTNEDTNLVVPLEPTVDADAVVEACAIQTNDTSSKTIEPDASQSANMTIPIDKGSAETQDVLPHEPKKVTCSSNESKPTELDKQAAAVEFLDSFSAETSAGRHSTDQVTRSRNESIPTESVIKAAAPKETKPVEPSMIMNSEDTNHVVPLEPTVDADAVVEKSATQTNDTLSKIIEPDASQSADMTIPITKEDVLPQDSKINESITSETHFVLKPTEPSVPKGDEEFCTAVERSLQESPKPTTTTTQEQGGFQKNYMCAENPLKCTVTKEYWESLVENLAAVAQCQETYDTEPSLVKFPSDIKEEADEMELFVVKSTISMEETNETPSDTVTSNIFLSQEKVDQVKASLENDREKIAMLLDSWGKDIQASVMESTNKGAVTRDEFVGIVKSWVSKMQVSTPTTTTSGNTATESKAFARETSSSGKFMSRMSDVACRELVLYNPYQSVANIEASFIKALQTPSTQGKTLMTDVSSDKTSVDEPNLNTIKTSLKKDSDSIRKSFQSIHEYDLPSTWHCEEISEPLERSCRELERHLHELIKYFSSIFGKSTAKSEVNGTTEGLSNNEVNNKSLGGRDEASMDIETTDSNECMLFVQVLGDIFAEDPNRIEASFKNDYQAIQRLVESHFGNNRDVSSEPFRSSKGKAAKVPRKKIFARTRKAKSENSSGVDEIMTCRSSINEMKVSEGVAGKSLNHSATSYGPAARDSGYSSTIIPASDKVKLNSTSGSTCRHQAKKARRTEPTDECKEALWPSTSVKKVAVLPHETISKCRHQAKKARRTEPTDECKEVLSPSTPEEKLVVLPWKTVAEHRRPVKKARYTGLMNLYKEAVSLSTQDKKAVVLTPETAEERRLPAKQAKKTELMNLYKEAVSLSAPEKKVDVLPHDAVAECRLPVKKARETESTYEYKTPKKKVDVPLHEAVAERRLPVKKAKETEPTKEYNEAALPSTPEKKVVLSPEALAEIHQQLKEAKKPELMNKYKETLSPSAPEKEVNILSPETVAKGLRKKLMKKYKEDLSPSTLEKKVDRLPSETVSGRRRPVIDPMILCKEDVFVSQPTPEMVDIRPPRKSKKKTLSTKMPEKPSKTAASDCETNNDNSNAIGKTPVSNQDDKATSFLGSIFDTLENTLVPDQVSDEREGKPSLRDLSSKRHQNASRMNGESSTKETINGSTRANGGRDQQRWKRPTLNRKARHNELKHIDRAFRTI